MIETVEYKNVEYPKFQTEGFAAQFAIPFAMHVCHGYGVDVGCGKEEWAFPGAIPIDLAFDDKWDAMNFPQINGHEEYDYIFSSHFLEHSDNWVDVLEYWSTKLKLGGTLFLYLPDYSQEYWRPYNNRKHNHILTPEILKGYLEDRGWNNIFVSGVDLNNSFMVMAER